MFVEHYTQRQFSLVLRYSVQNIDSIRFKKTTFAILKTVDRLLRIRPYKSMFYQNG